MLSLPPGEPSNLTKLLYFFFLFLFLQYLFLFLLLLLFPLLLLFVLLFLLLTVTSIAWGDSFMKFDSLTWGTQTEPLSILF